MSSIVSEDELVRVANQILEMVESAAFRDGLLSEEAALSSRYLIVPIKPANMTAWYKLNFFTKDPKESNSMHLQLVSNLHVNK